MKRVILHACCAPCASYPIKKLIEDNFEPIVYFFNPNIFPKEEYEIRKNELKEYCKKNNIEYFEEEYLQEEFNQKIKGYEQEPEKGKRCEICFKLRLLKTAHFAKQNNISLFTTTLTVSPHKNSKTIFLIAKEIEKETNITFLEYDFKKNDGFKISRQIAKENSMYAQNYCGCKYSIRN